ncbi:hypothetical protein TNCV_4102311 [Trichonephila clavipes]|nr:hypothetical protein TNCV_4102311 [Trichonephila clavipes]
MKIIYDLHSLHCYLRPLAIFLAGDESHAGKNPANFQVKKDLDGSFRSIKIIKDFLTEDIVQRSNEVIVSWCQVRR